MEADLKSASIRWPASLWAAIMLTPTHTYAATYIPHPHTQEHAYKYSGILHSHKHIRRKRKGDINIMKYIQNSIKVNIKNHQRQMISLNKKSMKNLEYEVSKYFISKYTDTHTHTGWMAHIA